MDIAKVKLNKEIKKILAIILDDEVTDTFEGHQGRKGKVGGSMPRGANGVECASDEDVKKAEAMTVAEKEKIVQLTKNDIEKMYENVDIQEKIRNEKLTDAYWILNFDYDEEGYREIDEDSEEYDEYYEEYGEEPEPISIEEDFAAYVVNWCVWKYTDNWFSSVNKLLRGEKLDEKYDECYYTKNKNGEREVHFNAEQIAKIIEDLCKANRLKENIRVFRGCGKGGIGALFGISRENVSVEELKKHIGEVGENKSFLSTSLTDKINFMQKPVVMSIYCPKGIEGAYLGGI